MTAASAPVEGVEAAEAAGNVAEAVHDLSVMGMFLQADIVVQLVMLGLLLASIWCWGVIFDKWGVFRRAFAHATRFQDKFWESDDLDECYEMMRKGRGHPMQRVFLAGMQEWYAANIKELGDMDASLKESIMARIGKIMLVARNRELDKLEHHLGLLATIGATAPFVGLFGTVWGIMNSFQNIAVEKNISLVVVAPGIAEALLATAIGLFAAIPAVIAYNRFSARVAQLGGMIEDFSTEFGALLSRQLDAKRV